MFYSAQWSSNKPPLPFPSAGHKKKKEVSPAFAAVSEKCLHSKDVFTLRMRRAEDERREERRILSYWGSGAGRRWEGREDGLIVPKER